VPSSATFGLPYLLWIIFSSTEELIFSLIVANSISSPIFLSIAFFNSFGQFFTMP